MISVKECVQGERKRGSARMRQIRKEFETGRNRKILKMVYRFGWVRESIYIQWSFGEF